MGRFVGAALGVLGVSLAIVVSAQAGIRGRPGQQGTFTTRGLPAGSYFAIAVGPLAGGEWQDPDYLRALRSSGETVPFTLTEGESTTVQLTAKK